MRKLTRKEKYHLKLLKARDFRVAQKVESIKGSDLEQHFLFFLMSRGLGDAVLSAKQLEKQLKEFEVAAKKNGVIK